MWARFWIGFFEYLLVRPLIRSNGIYVVLVTEFDAVMTAPFCFSYCSTDQCPPYVYHFNRYVDAMNFFNKTVRGQIVPTDEVVFSYFTWKKEMKKVISLKW